MAKLCFSFFVSAFMDHNIPVPMDYQTVGRCTVFGSKSIFSSCLDLASLEISLGPCLWTLLFEFQQGRTGASNFQAECDAFS